MQRDRLLHLSCALALLALGIPAAQADGSGSFYASTGFDYSSGKYGQPTSTTIWDVPFTAGYSGQDWSFRVTVPWIRVSGPPNVIPGIGVVQNHNPLGRGLGRLLGTGGTTPGATTSGTASGLGDVTAQATYHLVNDTASQFMLDVSGRVNFGTASANEGLGTGQNDYGAEVDVYKGLGSAWTAFGGVGYTDLGSSAYIQLRNVWSANAGVNYTMDQDDSAGLYFFYQQRPAASGYSRQEATLYYNHRVDTAWTLQGYMLSGFSNGSPDYGFGASAKYAF